VRRLALFAPLVALLVTAAGSAGPSPRTVAITAREFSFAPSRITARRGQRLVLRITNQGTMDHEFLSTVFRTAKDVAVETSGVKVEAGELEEVELEPGRTVEIAFTPTQAGTFPFWCAERFPGRLHRDLGMRGVLQVTP